MLSLWSVKFIHLYLPKLCLTSYWQVSVLCLQHTGVYIRSGLFGGTTGENNMVDLLIMSGVFFSIHFEWLDCGCVVADACILLVPGLCVVSSCWDSTSTSFLVKSSCSPPLWLDWQPFRKINKNRALYVFLLHFLAAVELIYTNRSVDFWCLTYSVSICQYVFPCCNNTYSSTRCLIRRKLHLHESSQVVLSF